MKTAIRPWSEAPDRNDNRSGHWSEWAACRDMPIDLFFPPDNLRGKRTGALEQAGKKVCGRCTVRAECLADAIATGEKWGIRGGLSPAERNRSYKAPARSCERAECRATYVPKASGQRYCCAECRLKVKREQDRRSDERARGRR